MISLLTPPGHQLAEHRVKPAGDLVTGPGQVPVPLGPHLQHRRVILGHHLAPGLRPQRRDRDRQGIVRVVLVRVPGLQQPHPGSELGRHVQHPLPGGDQLLGQQPAQPAGALHRPASAPATAPPTPPAARPGPRRRGPAARPAAPPPRRSPPRYASPYAGRSRSSLPSSARSSIVTRNERTAAGMPNTGLLALAPLSSHATARTDRLAPRSKARPQRGRQAVREPAHRTSERYGKHRNVTSVSIR